MSDRKSHDCQYSSRENISNLKEKSRQNNFYMKFEHTIFQRKNGIFVLSIKFLSARHENFQKKKHFISHII